MGADLAEVPQPQQQQDAENPPTTNPPNTGSLSGTRRISVVIPHKDPEPAQEKRSPKEICRIKAVFGLLFVIQIAANYDSGALAALFGDDSPTGITQDFNLNEKDKGLLGSLVYIGLTAGCIMMGPIMRYVPPPTMLSVSMFLNVGAALLFSLSPVKACLFVARVLVGVTQACLAIVCPVWVDEYAPEDAKSLWMALTMAGVPLGIVVGYLVAGLLAANTDLEWGWAFYIQCAFLGPLVLILFFVPKKYMDFSASPEEEGEKVSVAVVETERLSRRASALSTLGASFRVKRESEIPVKDKDGVPTQWSMTRLVKNTLLWAAVLALCSLYFVVTGLQLWVTDYLTRKEVGIEASLNKVVTAFGITAITAPVVGVVVGGVVLDKIGGYRGRIDKAALMALICGSCACAAAYTALALSNFWGFIVLVWVLLFFGATVVPALTGVIVASVELELRSLATAFSAAMFNMLGYFLGPLVCGIVADATGLKWGFRVVLGFSGVAVLCTIVTYILARRKAQEVLQSLKVEEVDVTPAVETAPFPEETPDTASPARTGSVKQTGGFLAVDDGQSEPLSRKVSLLCIKSTDRGGPPQQLCVMETPVDQLNASMMKQAALQAAFSVNEDDTKRLLLRGRNATMISAPNRAFTDVQLSPVEVVVTDVLSLATESTAGDHITPQAEKSDRPSDVPDIVVNAPYGGIERE